MAYSSYDALYRAKKRWASVHMKIAGAPGLEAALLKVGQAAQEACKSIVRTWVLGHNNKDDKHGNL